MGKTKTLPGTEQSTAVQDSISQSEQLADVAKESSDIIGDNTGWYIAKGVTGLVADPIQNGVNAIAEKVTPESKTASIVVRSDAKTILGADFNTLYKSETFGSVERTDSNGNVYSQLETNTPYDTSWVRYGTGDDVDYDMLSDHDKLTYEVTMLSKKYGYDYKNTRSDALLEAYQQELQKYKDYADSRDDISWNSVLGNVSAELQMESMGFSGKTDNLFSGGANDEERRTTNAAHYLMAVASKDYFADPAIPMVEGASDYSYADTINMSADPDANFGSNALKKATGFASGIATCFTGFFKKIKSYIDELKSTIKENAKEVSYINEKAHENGMTLDDALQHEQQVTSRYESAYQEFGHITEPTSEEQQSGLDQP